MDRPLHPDMTSLAPLLGTWRGTGRGEYPTIEPFDYEEEIVVDHAGDAWFGYRQTSWDPATGDALHWERGFLRPDGPGRIELVLAHPIGVVEVAHGAVTPGAFQTTTDGGAVARSRTGMEVTALVRSYRLDGDALAYEIDMATAATPLARHLVASLRRT